MIIDLNFDENKEFWDSKFSVKNAPNSDDEFVNIKFRVKGMPVNTTYTFISKSDSKFTSAGINKGYYKSNDCPY